MNEAIEHERQDALRTMERMTAEMVVITHRLARIGPGASVPPEAADADALVNQARSLRRSLERIEGLEIAAGLVVDHAYVR